MLGVEQWAELRRLHAVEGLSIREIGRRTGLHRATIRRALSSEQPPRYTRTPAGSKLDPFKDEIPRRSKWFTCSVTSFSKKRASCTRPDRQTPSSRFPAKAFCAEGQNRTGDTWFFSRVADASAESRLNFRAIAVGSS